MLTRVKEDFSKRSAVSSRVRSSMATLPKTLLIGLVTASFALVVHAQSAGSVAGTTAFKASVVDLGESTTRVTVPLDRSVTIETTVPVSSARVVSSNVADIQIISPSRLLLTGQNYGSTSVVLIGSDQQQYIFDVWVELDLDRLNEALALIDALGDAKATSMRGHILLTGTVSSAQRAEQMVDVAMLFLPTGSGGAPLTSVQNHLEVAGEQQVLIRCMVAEMTRSAMRELGVNGFLAGENLKDVFAVNQVGGINPISIGAAANSLVTENVPFLTSQDGIPITSNPTLSLGFPRAQTQVFLKALAENSLLSVLAEPNLVAISGETATFLAGGEFPIPVPQGNQQVTIEFREFGIRLNFTPVVKGGQIIRLRVAPEVSQLDFTTAVQIEGFVVPGLTSRATETTVELGSGQTIAIGGLLNEEIRGISSQIPGIGDVPVLGALFRSVSFQRSLTELVILVTPEIVAPLETHQAVRLPTEGRTNPDDFELYMLGLLDGLENDSTAEAAHGDDDDAPPALGSEPEEISMHGPWGLSELLDMQ